MASPSLTQVNQKLAFCRALMQLVQQAPEPVRADDRLRRQGLLDGAAFHLLCAYRHYLRELAENYSLPKTRYIGTEDDLLEALQRLGKNPSEARELKNLRADANSWLAELEASHNACWQPAPSADPGQRIQVVNLDAPDAEAQVVTWEGLQRWYGAFNALVERQRETSVEC